MNSRLSILSIAWVVLCTGWLFGYWLVLVLQSPILSNLPGWFWTIRPLHIIQWSAVLVSLLLLIIACPLIYSVSSKKYVLTLGVLTGTATQLLLSQWSGWGWEQLTWKLEHTGHHMFVKFALLQHNWVDVISDYNNLVKQSGYGEFLLSKGPGSVLFYQSFVPLARLSSVFFNIDIATAMHRVLALIWPLFGFLTLVPLLLWLGRYSVESVLKWTTIFLVLNPAWQLISLHLDQVLFPLLAVWFVAWTDRAVQRLNLWEGLVLGIVGYIVLFINFALIWPLMIAGCWAMYVAYGDDRGLKPFFRWSLLILAGFALAALCFYWLFDYHFLRQYHIAIENHHRAKFWQWRLDYVLYYALYNPLEWITWAGPLMACVIGLRASLLLFSHSSIMKTRMDQFMWVCIVVMAILCLVGQTKGETARLWLFMVPWYSALAAYSIDSFKSYRLTVAIVLAISQSIHLFLIRVIQDFA